jgi:hypothetical protein
VCNVFVANKWAITQILAVMGIEAILIQLGSRRKRKLREIRSATNVELREDIPRLRSAQ